MSFKHRPADIIPYRFLQGNCVTCFVYIYASFLDEFFHAVQRVTVRQGKHSLRQIGREHTAAGQNRRTQRGIRAGHDHHFKRGVAVVCLAAEALGNRSLGALEHLHHNGGNILEFHGGMAPS